MSRPPESIAESISKEGAESGIILQSFRDKVERDLRALIMPLAEERVRELTDAAVASAMDDFRVTIQAIVERNFASGDLVMQVVLRDARTKP